MYHIHRQIHSHLQEAQNIVVVAHQNPDGDTLGSVSALKEYIEGAEGKKVRLFCLTPSPASLHFIPHVHGLTTDPEIFADHTVDTIIVCDAGDLRYSGIDEYVKNHPATIINIDHHPTNENYGHINLVVPEAASTTEIIYYFLKNNGVAINHNLATALLSGLITDTGNFSNSATTTSAVNVASHLVRRGANLSLINKETLKNSSLTVLKLWGVVLERLEKVPNTELIYTYITQNDLKNYNATEEDTAGVANFLNTIGDAKICLILKELPDNQVKGSFRTTRDDVDVSALAQTLGGGGHQKAAGFTTTGTIPQVVSKILTLTKK